MLEGKKLLVLAPHTDDGEFGCGGSIVKLSKQNYEIYYAAFSLCENSVPEGWPKNILEKELYSATSILNILASNILIYKYPVRRFDQYRQDILEDLVELNRKLKPSVVFMPSYNDLHQDHYIVAKEAMRAFKQTTVLAYEMPWNNITFSTQLFIKLNKEEIEIKIKALKEYKSQSTKSYANEEFIHSLAYTRGVSIGAKYAEAFEVVRWVIE